MTITLENVDKTTLEAIKSLIKQNICIKQMQLQNLNILNERNKMNQNAESVKSKTLGQVFTPPYIVELMLNLPQNQTLRNKKILEAGCGDGAFLTQIVRNYIKQYLQDSSDLSALKAELEQNIIGIDIDSEAIDKCRLKLDNIAQEFGLKDIEWNLQNGDFLELWQGYKGQIDLMIGNPPYIRVHNLKENARKLSKGGMTDLYLIFFELGFECLKDGGSLTFITPSSWLNSRAGADLREKIKAQRHLVQLIDFAHERVFDNIATYSLISAFIKGKSCESVSVSDYKNGKIINTRDIRYDSLFVKDMLFLGNTKYKGILELKPSLQVKNGFATLCDSFFFGDFTDLKYPKIRAYKASNGKWCDCIYPYNVMSEFDRPDGDVLERYKEYETRLKARDLRGADWMEFGRSQGINDTYKRKIAFNTLIRETKDLRICEVEAGAGVYGGLYIVSDLPLVEFERILRTDEFLGFVRSLGKYKNGGYYTFSSADLGRYLSNKICKKDKR